MQVTWRGRQLKLEGGRPRKSYGTVSGSPHSDAASSPPFDFASRAPAPSSPANPSAQTICLLLEPSLDAFQRFVPAPNTLAENEVRAHVTMFEPTKNDGYYQLALEAAAVVRQAITNRRSDLLL
ncbi:hypothetical protein V8E52_009375 [Russula decolorans]